MINNVIETRKKYMKNWRKKNKEKINEYQRNWRKENQERVKKYNAEYWERKSNEEEVIAGE